MTEWIAQAHANTPYIDNSSFLTVGFVLQIFAVMGLTWKLAQVNTSLEVRLHRMEYDMDNLANKMRELVAKEENHKKKLNEMIRFYCEREADCNIDFL